MSLPPLSGSGIPLLHTPPSGVAETINPSPTPQTSPATRVSLSAPQPHPVPPVYSLASSQADYLRHQYDTGAGYVISQQLLAEQTALRASNAPFRASPFFSQMGGLSAETTSFRNEVRSFKVPADIATDKYSPEFSGLAGRRKESVTLNIRTKDGDDISIQLVRRQGSNGESLEFAFEVTGNLSQKEQAALDKLASKLGAVADEFFRTGTAELRGLAEVDDSSIQSFSLTLSKPKPADPDRFDTLEYNFSIDENSQTRRLQGKDVAGYEFDIRIEFQDLLKTDKLSAHQTLEQYLTLIRQAGNARGTGSESIRFMLDGLRSLFSLDNTVIPANNPLALPTEFLTGLADFTASFRSPISYNPENRTQVSAMHLTMGQSTRIETDGARLLVQQDSFYDLQNTYFRAPYWLEAADFTDGNYVYVKEHQSGNTKRTLDMTPQQINHLLIEREQTRHVQEEVYREFQKIDGRNDEFNDRQLYDLIDQLSVNPPQNNPQAYVVALLKAERLSLFK